MEDFSKEVIKAIDKSEVIDKYCIKSPILGRIAPSMLSGGTKTLLMIMYTDKRFYFEAMGDNCLSILKRICDIKDVFMCSTCYRPLFKNGFNEIFIENTNTIVTSVEEYLELELKYGGEGE